MANDSQSPFCISRLLLLGKRASFHQETGVGVRPDSCLRMGGIGRVLFQLAVGVLFLVGVCRAQDIGTGMEISGFRVPDYDEKDQVRAQLYGEHAVVLENREVEITNLKIDMYKDGEVVMTVFSPHCFFNMDTRLAHSDGRVLIESGLMTVTGRGFTWSAAAGRFEILHDSKVLVKEEAKVGVKGLEL